MRLLALVAVLLLGIAFSGCTSPVRLADCDGTQQVTLHIHPDGRLRPTEASPGLIRLSSAGSVLLLDDADTFLTASLDPGLHITGTVIVEAWLEAQGVSAFPQSGYQVYTLFGTQTALAPGGHISTAQPVQDGTTLHTIQELTLPAGGIVAEEGEQLRLMMASLVQAGEHGHDLLLGGTTPSQVRFDARCEDIHAWEEVSRSQEDVQIVANTGLFTGAVAVPELHTLSVPFELAPQTDRLTIVLRGTMDRPGNDDMDIYLVQDGLDLWSATSPSQDETMRLHAGNLRLLTSPGAMEVRVVSYSGLAYTGVLEIVQEKDA